MSNTAAATYNEVLGSIYIQARNTELRCHTERPIYALLLMAFSLSNAARHQQGNQRKIQIPSEVLSSWFLLPGQRGGCVQEGLLWSHIGRSFRQNYFAQGLFVHDLSVKDYVALFWQIASERLMAYTMFPFAMTTVICRKWSTVLAKDTVVFFCGL